MQKAENILFAKKLQTLLALKRLRVIELDKKLGFPSGTTEKFLRGKDRPLQKTIAAYSEALAVDASVLWLDLVSIYEDGG